MRVLIAVVACAGCNQIFGLDPPGTVPPDMGPGSDVDTTACFGKFGSFSQGVCLKTQPSGMLDLPATISTDDPCSTNVLDPNLCVLDARTIRISGTTRVRGTRRLILVAADTLIITGTLDAASHLADGAGPGAEACTFAAAPSKQDGGAGGSFQALGGSGGVGGGGSDAGTPLAVPVPDNVAGGCGGQNGGADTGATATGTGGAGGGALWLIAGGTIQVDGSVNASGAGGRGAQDMEQGGGGGGAGGMIVLDAPTLAIAPTSKLFADGGGGGGGATATAAGSAGSEADGIAPAAGGTSPAGAGGAGAHGAVLVGTTGDNANTGAGGGGGGAGWIFIRAGNTPPAAAFSPAVATFGP